VYIYVSHKKCSRSFNLKRWNLGYGVKHFKIIREMERTDKEQLFSVDWGFQDFGTLDFRQCLAF